MRIVYLLLAGCTAVCASASQESAPPLFFLRNHAQAPSSVKFIGQAPRLTVYFSPGEALLRNAGGALRMRFEGAGAANPEPVEQLSGELNILVGGPEQWSRGEPIYAGISYRGLYPGIDMIYGAAGRNLKSEFIVAAAADPAVIRVRYSGAEVLGLEPDGSLRIRFGGEEFHEAAPTIYQEIDGARTAVPGAFVLVGDVVSFEIGAYDRSRPLVIDPAISYSTLLGGSGADLATAIALDSKGAAYVAGFTESYDFPTAGAAQSANAGGNDAFIAKLSPNGLSLVYCTYIGGSGDDRAAAIAVDSSGAAYVTGSTTSQNFPLRGAAQSSPGGGRDAFALKLSPAGNTLIYSSYLGGSGPDTGNAIAVDSAGDAYIAGDTSSLNFPAGGFQRSDKGGQDAFVAKLSPDGTRLVYSTYLGGTNTDHAAAIAVDATASAWVAGSTWSTNFPTAQAFQGALAGGQDAFVARLSADGNALPFSSYLGGANGATAYPEAAQAIALDAQGNAYLAGVTSSSNFPLMLAAQSVRNGLTDAFVTKVTALGSLAYSTYFGGSGPEVANAIAVDANGSAYVTGYTYSTDLPVTSNAMSNASAGEYDAFLARLAPNGSLDYASYLGGMSADTATAIATSSGNVYICGWTLSGDFPLASPYQGVDGNGYGGFIVKQNFAPPTNTGASPSSGWGVSQTFSFQFTDSKNPPSLTSVGVLFNSAANTAKACAVIFNPALNTLSLLTDDGQAQGTISPGGGSQLNSYCVLNGAGSTASQSGAVLTLKLALTFQAASTGHRNIYMQSSNSVAATNWQQSGSWITPALITSPSPGSRLPGSAVTFRWSTSGDFPSYWFSANRGSPGWFINSSAGSNSSITLTNIPTDGGNIIVRLYSQNGSSWVYADFSFTAASPAPLSFGAATITPVIIVPVSGATLFAPAVTFGWLPSPGVSEYWLYLSTASVGRNELYSASQGSNTSKTFTGLPPGRNLLYVRLWWRTGTTWAYSDLVYTIAG